MVFLPIHEFYTCDFTESVSALITDKENSSIIKETDKLLYTRNSPEWTLNKSV